MKSLEKIIVFHETEDEEITCIACMYPKCELEVKFWDARMGSSTFVGMHKKCLAGSMKRMK